MALAQNLTLPLMQTSWASQLNPLISNPLNSISILKNVSLINGTNSINHLLGEKLQGWFIVGINGAASVYDTQATNLTPQLTLILISNAAVMANIAVF